MTVSSIIVTYNRKAELLRCIEAVLSQTIKPDNLLIVNNASTDGTENAVYQMFGAFVPMQQVDHDVVFKSVNSGITPVYLINKKSNSGGSGGFYIGLKAAHECFKTDCYWMMDDDGYPSIKCLERQLIYIERYDYVMPISIDIDNHDKLSWATKKRNGKKTISYLELKNDFGEIMPFIFPFNGSLLSLNLIKKVGYIKPELFIWGMITNIIIDV